MKTNSFVDTVLEEVFSDEAMRDIIFPVVPAAIIQIDVIQI
jgi:hypothetical protein